MFKEGKCQRAGLPDAYHASANHIEDLGKILRTAVGEFFSFDVGPKSLHGIQIGSIPRQPLHIETTAFALKEVRHHAALVGREAVPPIAQRRTDQETSPVKSVDQDWGFPSWRPGSPDGRALRYSVFVLKDPCSPTTSVFLQQAISPPSRVGLLLDSVLWPASQVAVESSPLHRGSSRYDRGDSVHL